MGESESENEGAVILILDSNKTLTHSMQDVLIAKKIEVIHEIESPAIRACVIFSPLNLIKEPADYSYLQHPDYIRRRVGKGEKRRNKATRWH